MDRVRILLALLVGLAFPAAATQPADVRGINPSLACGSQGPDTLYFPAGTFRPVVEDDLDLDRWDRFQREWYSQQLAAMREPSLTCGDVGSIEAVRFLWLRAFNEPIAIRITKSGTDYALTTTTLAYAPGMEIGAVQDQYQKPISEDEWMTLVSSLAPIRFWEMPADVANAGGDGSYWVIEVRLNGRYHVATRWAGGHGLRQIGIAMLILSGLQIDPDDVY